MPKINDKGQYPNDDSIDTNDSLLGTDYNNSNKTKNFSIGSILNFIKSETINLYEVDGYLVWKGSGVKDETMLRQGNIALGRGTILTDVILGEVLQDDPTTEDHFNMLISTT